jgi:hypothetical protein
MLQEFCIMRLVLNTPNEFSFECSSNAISLRAERGGALARVVVRVPLSAVHQRVPSELSEERLRPKERAHT